MMLFIVSYVALLCGGAMIIPGLGMTGRLLVQLPPVLVDWAHAPCYGLLAWLLMRGLERRAWPFGYALMTASGASLVFGLFTEVLQASVPGRSPSASDLLLDALGIGSVVARVLVNRSRSQYPGPAALTASPVAMERVSLR
ncbi:MAG TPA: VanZ family protein [Nitrospira sp.]|nr:VanZ family protein [Nitrospira sp.]